MRLRLWSSVRKALAPGLAGGCAIDPRICARRRWMQLRLGRADLGGDAAGGRSERRGAAIVANRVLRTLRTHQSIPQGHEEHRIIGAPPNGVVACIYSRLRAAAVGVTLKRRCID
jgi:hypothetical protein